MGFQFIPQLIETDVCVKDKEEVIRYLADKLKTHGCSDAAYADKVLLREQEYPTGLRTKCAAIAIPHAFDQAVSGNHVALAILQQPIRFCNMEDMDSEIDVDMVFLMAISSAHEQLGMLQTIMRMLGDDTLFTRLVKLHDADEVCRQLNAFIEGQKS